MAKRSLVLVVGSFKGIISELISYLNEEGFEVEQIKPASLVSRKRYKDCPALVLLELTEKNADYLKIFREIKKRYTFTPVVVFSPFAPAYSRKIFQMIQEGAYDYIKEPFVIDEVKILIRKALKENLYNRRKRLNSFSSLFPDFIVGENPKMREMLDLVKEIASTDFTILIEGESGTGKDMIASVVHKLSKRKDKPFLRLNCAALTESIAESELFGYEKGAFTGADTRKIGLFSAAQGGTLFLNEIAEASLGTQAKLLQVIENKEFIPVGSVTPIKCDVRLIIATNKDLKEEIKKNRFRSDLYYRISIFTLSLPPLRERKEDIPIFIKHYLKKYSLHFSKDIRKISPRVYKFLLNYSWPGNIRELEATILKMIVVSKGPVITLEEVEKVLPGKGSFPSGHLFLPFEEAKREFLQSFEKQYIKDLLIICKGNVAKMAREAKVTRSFIYQKIKQYGIDLSFYREKISHFLALCFFLFTPIIFLFP